MGNYVDVTLILIACAGLSAALGFVLGVDWSRRKIEQSRHDLDSENA